MWCIKCNRDMLECECPDVDEVDQLESLYDYGLGLAARQNVNARKVKWDTITLEKDAT